MARICEDVFTGERCVRGKWSCATCEKLVQLPVGGAELRERWVRAPFATRGLKAGSQRLLQLSERSPHLSRAVCVGYAEHFMAAFEPNRR
jgi:hypothetical protein